MTQKIKQITIDKLKQTICLIELEQTLATVIDIHTKNSVNEFIDEIKQTKHKIRREINHTLTTLIDNIEKSEVIDDDNRN